MHSNNRVSVSKAKDTKWETTTGTACILARVIDEEIAKTKASFFTLGSDTY